MHQRRFELPRLNKTSVILWVAVFILAALVLPLAAEEKPAESGWQVHVAPYMWAVAVDGNATVRGLEADVDLSFSDIWDELNMAFMLEYEARKGRWGFLGNTFYANLGGSDVSGPLGLAEIEPTVKLFYQGLGGFYRLGTWDLADGPGKKNPSVTLDAYAGFRYTYIDLEVDFKGVFRGREKNVSGDKSWVEPLIGVRSIWDLSNRWSLTLAGDIGGVAFGSDFAWNAVGLVGYRFSLFGEDNARVVAGYRALYQDYTDGSGDNKFQWDVTLHGPILGLTIVF